MMRLLPAMTVMLLLGCSTPPPPPRPVAEEAALRWSQRGAQAYRRGEWREALAAFEEAWRGYASLDRADNAAGELLNISAVHFRAGEHAAMRRALDRIFDAGAAVSPPLRAEAGYRYALLEFETGASAQAAHWLDRSLALCGELACSVAGPVANLRARIALAEQDLDQAEAQAQRAIELNGRAGNIIEQANAHRVRGEIALARGAGAQAETEYARALELDRVAGDPAKILRDLLGLAHSLSAQGQAEAAREYARRARDVAHSVGDAGATQQAEAYLGRSGSR
jgi:tetratricopeptide (TPR) repeat protein